MWKNITNITQIAQVVVIHLNTKLFTENMEDFATLEIAKLSATL